jgi:dTDP-4-dehydrorhamnose reductase
MIKTSILGPELNSKSSVFEWFMNSEGEVFGWTKNYWNGITTLQWAMICYDMIISWDTYLTTNIPATECISKYELLNIIKKVFEKDIVINKNSDVIVNRCLDGTIDVSNIEKQLTELKEFYYDN